MATDYSAAIITHVGMEDVCASEVKSLLSLDCETQPGVVYFSAPLLELCDLCYRVKSALRVLVLLGKKQGSDIPLVAHNLASSVDVSGWLSPSVSFACRSPIPELGMELEAEVGGILQEKSKAKVDLKNPDVKIILHGTEETVLLGVDLGGDELGKRDYRIFVGSDSLRGTLAYGLLKISG